MINKNIIEAIHMSRMHPNKTERYFHLLTGEPVAADVYHLLPPIPDNLLSVFGKKILNLMQLVQ